MFSKDYVFGIICMPLHERTFFYFLLEEAINFKFSLKLNVLFYLGENLVISGCRGGNIKLWSTESCSLVGEMKGICNYNYWQLTTITAWYYSLYNKSIYPILKIFWPGRFYHMQFHYFFPSRTDKLELSIIVISDR